MSMFEGASPFPAPETRPGRRDALPGSDAPSGAAMLPDVSRARAAVSALDQADPADVPSRPGAGLTGLLERARAAQARLGDQPLPIANRDMLLITKLLGG